MMRWLLLQRGRWVHGQPTLFAYLADLARYRLSDVAARLACPTLVTQAEGDRIGGAGQLFGALTVERKALLTFTAAEGAAGHCEATARRVYHQRVYDWLDETLGPAGHRSYGGPPRGRTSERESPATPQSRTT